MTFEFIVMTPDVLLLFFTFLIFGMHLGDYGGENTKYKLYYKHTMWILILALFVTLSYQLCVPCIEVYYFNNIFHLTFLSFFFRIVIYILAIICVFFIFLSNKNVLNLPLIEFSILLPLLVLGMCLLISSNELITAFLCMELQSLILYIFIASCKNSNLAAEAALRYFVLSSFGSAFFFVWSFFNLYFIWFYIYKSFNRINAVCCGW